jgi:hypothetical protein
MEMHAERKAAMRLRNPPENNYATTSFLSACTLRRSSPG